MFGCLFLKKIIYTTHILSVAILFLTYETSGVLIYQIIYLPTKNVDNDQSKYICWSGGDHAWASVGMIREKYRK
jgi:hypothetical protein